MTTDTKILKANLKVLSKSTKNKSKEVIVSIENDILKVATDEVSFTQYLSNTVNKIDDCEVELRLIDLKKAVEVVKTLSITIEISNNSVVVGNTNLKTSKQNIYKKESPQGIELKIPAVYFTDALSKCTLYSSEAFKPVLQGILFDFQKGKLILASTNGKVLNKETLIINNDIEKRITLKTEAIKSLLELKKQNRKIHGQDEFSHADFSIIIHDLYVEFIYKNRGFGTFVFNADVMDGKFPNVDAAIPDFSDKENRTISFSKNEAIECIKQLSFICKESKYRQLIYLKMKNNKLSFYAFSNNSEMKLDIECSYDCKESTTICYDFRYLLSVLNIIDRSNTIDLKLIPKKDDKNNFSISGIEFINAVYLIMPTYAEDYVDISKKMEKLDNNIDDSSHNTNIKETDNMRIYASDKEDKKYSRKQGNKYLKGYCFENKNGKLCQVGKFFYRAGYFLDAIKQLGFDVNKIQIVESRLLQS